MVLWDPNLRSSFSVCWLSNLSRRYLPQQLVSQFTDLSCSKHCELALGNTVNRLTPQRLGDTWGMASRKAHSLIVWPGSRKFEDKGT